jgi:hypothetical protein
MITFILKKDILEDTNCFKEKKELTSTLKN